MIEAENASFTYQSAPSPALQDVTLTVQPGECVVLCGRSGCGKTTFTHLLNGLSPEFYPGTLTGRCTAAGLAAGEAAIEAYVPQGGSVCIGMLPIFLYCARWGCKESFLASFAYGLLQLIFDGAYAWGPTSMLFDYVLAYGVLGVACLFRKQKGGVYIGTVVGCLCRFLVHFISGITIYRIYEPTELFNTTFANPYIYSAAYNGSYMVIDLVLCLVITALLYRPLSRYFAPQETVAAVKRNQGPEL